MTTTMMMMMTVTLSNHDDDGSEKLTKKIICVFSNFIAYIWNCSIRQM